MNSLSITSSWLYSSSALILDSLERSGETPSDGKDGGGGPTGTGAEEDLLLTWTSSFISGTESSIGSGTDRGCRSGD